MLAGIDNKFIIAKNIGGGDAKYSLEKNAAPEYGLGDYNNDKRIVEYYSKDVLDYKLLLYLGIEIRYDELVSKLAYSMYLTSPHSQPIANKASVVLTMEYYFYLW